MKNRAIVSSGSNIDPVLNTEKAGKILSENCTLLAKSSFHYTTPVGYANQPDFYNGAFLVETEKEKQDFILLLKEIENRLHRKRTANKADPRTIDLDLIFWNNECVHADYPSAGYVRIPVDELLLGLQSPTKN